MAKQQEADRMYADMDAFVKKHNSSALTAEWQRARADWTTLADRVSQKQISVIDSFNAHLELCK